MIQFFKSILLEPAFYIFLFCALLYLFFHCSNPLLLSLRYLTTSSLSSSSSLSISPRFISSMKGSDKPCRVASASRFGNPREFHSSDPNARRAAIESNQFSLTILIIKKYYTREGLNEKSKKEEYSTSQRFYIIKSAFY